MVTDLPQGRRFTSDLLILFGKPGCALPHRISSTEYRQLEAHLDWQLLQQPPGLGWKGYPITELHGELWRAWLLGELYGQADISLVVSNVLEGRSPPSGLNGHWLLLAWNTSSREWHVWTNRFATLHGYYAQRNGSAALGTFFPAVAAVGSRRRLDWLGLTAFFGFGFFPQDRTFFEDVRILQPASHYVFDVSGGLVRQQRYWRWRHEPELKRSYADTVEEFAVVFHAVMRDLLAEGRIALPISGGLDSRSTVAALPHAVMGGTGRLWTYSYGYSDDSVEIQIARQVARGRDLPFTAFTIGEYLFNELDQVLECVEGFQDVTQCRQAAVAASLGRNADYVVAAHMGDLWLDDTGLVTSEGAGAGEESLVDGALRKTHKQGSSWLLAQVCSSHVDKQDTTDHLRAFIRSGLRDLNHLSDPDFRLKAFKVDNWVFRWTNASLRMFQAAAFPRLPFYDSRLADFFCGVPTDFVRGRRLQIDYLKRFAPDLAGIKWQKYDTDLYRCRHFDTWLLPKRALKKVCRILSRRRVIERNWEVQFLTERGREGLQNWLLRPGLRIHDFVPLTQLRGVLDEFYSNPPDASRGYTLSMLLTFSAALEQFG